MPMDNKYVFEVFVTVDRNWRRPHYPKYTVAHLHVGAASSFDKAEGIIKKILDDKSFSNIHHFNIRKVGLDEMSIGSECYSEWLYDCNGQLIDSSLISNMRSNPGLFSGRTEEQYRFHEGDIVEVENGDEISLAFVVAVPPSVERALKINTGTQFHLDDSDDNYIVLTDESYWSHDHVSPLYLFKPKYRMHPAVERRFRKYYEDYKTSDMRLRIAATTAISRIKEITDVIGVECDVSQYYDEGILLSFPGYPQPDRTTTIVFYNPRAFDHMDRVKITLQRFFGAAVKGRGYSLHRDEQKENSFSTLR